VLLLNGYEKAGDPSGKRQQHAVAIARSRLAECEERQARERKRKSAEKGRHNS